MYLKIANQLIQKIDNEIYRFLPTHINKDFISLITNDKTLFFPLSSMEQIQEPARELLLTGGKRWRPLLTIIAALICSKKDFSDEDKITLGAKVGAIVELAHNGSLIIDDIEDSAKVRRSYPCAHIRFGTDLAINGGNYLYFLPSLAIDELPLPQDKLISIYKTYSRQMRCMHLGQGLDILWHKEKNFFPTLQEYSTMCHLKTGALSQMAIELGAIIGNATEEQQKILIDIAKNVGLAFQIIDDITNLEVGNPGKERGDDLIEGKKSLPLVIFANNNDPNKLISLMKTIQSNGLQNAKTEVDSLVSLLVDSGAMSSAKEIATSSLTKAITLIEENFIPSQPRDMLIWLIRNFQK